MSTKQTYKLQETVLQKIALRVYNMNIPHCPAVPQMKLSSVKPDVSLTVHRCEICGIKAS